MATSERRVDRGRRAARRALTSVGDELRESRIQAGLSQREVAALVAMSHSEVGRIERGVVLGVPYGAIAIIASVVGLDVPLRAYPNGDAVRDAAQLALLARFRATLPKQLRHSTEVPIGVAGDNRAWDEVIIGPGWTLPVEAETRLRDVQALSRRLALKRRDAGVDRMVLLVSDTRQNRGVLRLHAAELAEAYPLRGRAAVASLQRCQPITASAIVVA